MLRRHLAERAVIVGCIGIMLLSCGTGSWRVRWSMNIAVQTLGMTCSADIGLVSIEYTCMDENESYTQALSIPRTGVNTSKLDVLEKFMRQMEKDGQNWTNWTVGEIHSRLSRIDKLGSSYAPWMVALAAALACSAFVFLLGGGPVEMVCCFVGAGFGNYVRRKMVDHHITLYACIAVAVTVASVAFLLSLMLMQFIFYVNSQHEAGYIGAMLFIIPGFPFITSGLDLSKLDMRSGLERLSYAVIIIDVATMMSGLVTMLFRLKPDNFIKLPLTPLNYLLLRLPASFCGVFGFSIMFNFKSKMVAIAGLIGAVANTLRLELGDAGMPLGAAAFLGALTAGLLASIVRRKIGYPRISITIPSIVIIVPGLYMYRAVYNIELTAIGVGALWLTRALIIVAFLPLGLIAARIMTDTTWRHNNS